MRFGKKLEQKKFGNRTTLIYEKIFIFEYRLQIKLQDIRIDNFDYLTKLVVFCFVSEKTTDEGPMAPTVDN